MKNLIFFSIFSLLFFAACDTASTDPLAAVDRSLNQTTYTFLDESSVKLYTIDQDISVGREKQVMKMSVDFNTSFDRLGVFMFTEDQKLDKKDFKKLASIDLTSDKVEESHYVGKKIFSLSQQTILNKPDKINVNLKLHNEKDNLANGKVISEFQIFEPNMQNYGIQHFENNQIPNDDFIRVYDFKLQKAKVAYNEDVEKVYEPTGRSAKIVMMFYNSNEEEDVMEIADWNTNSILMDESLGLRIINRASQTASAPYIGANDFKGFAFGQDK